MHPVIAVRWAANSARQPPPQLKRPFCQRQPSAATGVAASVRARPLTPTHRHMKPQHHGNQKSGEMRGTRAYEASRGRRHPQPQNKNHTRHRAATSTPRWQRPARRQTRQSSDTSVTVTTEKPPSPHAHERVPARGTPLAPHHCVTGASLGQSDRFTTEVPHRWPPPV